MKIGGGGGGADTLRFQDLKRPGEPLKVVVKHTEAIEAILRYPDYFRMGAAGPDAYPDIMSGQMYPHVNKSAKGQTSDKLEQRRGPYDFRSSDYGVLLLHDALSRKRYDGSIDTSYFAFALGYWVHVLGDGFGHTWVNEAAGAPFDYLGGHGLFGPLSEEIKHIAVEGFMDHLGPRSLYDLPNDSGYFGRVRLIPPAEKLDQFYSRVWDGQKLLKSNDILSMPVGGPIFAYYNAQELVLNDVKMIAAHPLIQAAQGYSGPITKQTIEVLLDLSGLGMFKGTSVVDAIAEMIGYTGQVPLNPPNLTERLGVLQSKNNALRRAWVQLAGCQAENLAKPLGLDSLDRCQQVATEGFWLAGLNGYDALRLDSTLHKLYRLEKGADHHDVGANVHRTGNYLLNTFILPEIIEEMQPQAIRDAWTRLEYGLAQDGVQARLLDAAFIPAATTLAQSKCDAENLVCTGSCVIGTLKNCTSICGSFEDWLTGGALCTKCAIENSGICPSHCVYKQVAECYHQEAQRILKQGSLASLHHTVKSILDTLESANRYLVSELQTGACQVADYLGAPIHTIYKTAALYSAMGEINKKSGYSLVNLAYLQEDLADPTWRQTLLSAAGQQVAPLLDSVATGRVSLYQDLQDFNPPQDAHAKNCLDFDASPYSQQIAEDPVFQRLMNLQPLLYEPGPTAQRFMRAFGDSLPHSFDPLYNTIQAAKLIPLIHKADIEALFAHSGVEQPSLPWLSSNGDHYSFLCKKITDNYASLFCDVVASLDDPNGMEAGAGGEPYMATIFGNSVEWDRSRSVVVWNPYVAVVDAGQTVNKPWTFTNFPLAANQQTIDSLYTRIFRTPEFTSGRASIDREPFLYTLVQGGAGANIYLDSTMHSEGLASMALQGSGYITVASPLLNTTDFGMISPQFSVDVYVPRCHTTMGWKGDFQMYFTLGSFMENQLLVGAPSNSLDPLPEGRWHTFDFTLNSWQYELMQGDHANLQFTMMANLPSGECEPLRMDYPRFIGPEIIVRNVYHNNGSQKAGVAIQNASFEQSGDYRLRNGALLRTDSLGAWPPVGQWEALVSQPFATCHQQTVGDTLSVNLYVPNPQPNPWWVGSLGAEFRCPEAQLYHASLGEQTLRNLFREEWNRLDFAIPADVLAILKGNHTGCQWQFNLNTSADTVPFRLAQARYTGKVHPVNACTQPVLPIDSTEGFHFRCDDMCQKALPMGFYAPLGDVESHYWFVLDRKPMGWRVSQAEGRTIEINGVPIVDGDTQWPEAVNGKWYVHFGPGGQSWGQWNVW